MWCRYLTFSWKDNFYYVAFLGRRFRVGFRRDWPHHRSMGVTETKRNLHRALDQFFAIRRHLHESNRWRGKKF